MTNRPFIPAMTRDLKVDPDKPKPAPMAHDNSPGVLERAMSNTLSPDEVAAQVPQALSNDTDRVLRTSIMGDGTVITESISPMQGSTADRPLGTEAVKDIRGQDGTPQSVNSMDMDSIVTLLDGGEVRLDSAIEAGILALTENGALIAGNDAPPPKAKEQQDEIHEDLKAVSLDAESEAVIDALNTDVSAGTQVEAISEMAAEGEISERVMNLAASEAGVEPAVMHERAGKIQQAMFNQASDRVAKMGVDPAALWEHANEHMREQLGKAVREQLMNRTLHSYDELAKSYIENLDTIDPEAVLAADYGEGFKGAHRDDKGNIVLTGSDGVTYSWKSAVRAGLVKLG